MAQQAKDGERSLCGPPESLTALDLEQKMVHTFSTKELLLKALENHESGSIAPERVSIERQFRRLR